MRELLPSTADYYDLLGIAQHKLGDFASALESNKRALEIRLKLFGEEHSKTADRCYSLGVTLHSLGNFKSALESDKRALDIRLKLFGEDHSETADSYYSLGVNQYSLSDFVSARESHQRALDIRLKLFGTEHSTTADSYYSIGVTQNALGDFASARESNQRALDIKLKLCGKENPADIHHSLWAQHRTLGDDISAAEMKLFPEEYSKIANTYYSLGITQHVQRNFPSALESNNRALEIRRKLFGEEHSKTADSYYSLGVTQHALGQFISARKSNTRALEIRLKLFGEEHSKTADSYDSLGVTQQEQGDFDSALESNRHALAIRLKLFGEEHSKTADSYFSLGVTQHSLRHFSLALESHKRSLHTRQKLFGEEHPKTADSYYSLGVTQHSLGNFVSALESSKRALQIRLKLFGERHSKIADSYYSLGITQHSLKDFIPALQSKKLALDVRLKLFGKEHYKTADSYYSLGVTQHSLGELIYASESKKRAHDIRHKLRMLGEDNSATSGNEHDESTCTSYIAKETPENELRKENESNVKVFGNLHYGGGVFVAEDVQVIFPYGAIGKQVDHVAITVTLEKPCKHCDMLVKNGLENDVMFIAPVINLQPNGQVFTHPVTVATKLTIDKEASLSDVLILHGVQASDGKIVWQDITHKSKIDLEKKEMKVEIERFSRIAALLRFTLILTKNVITRLNLIGFNYTLSMLFKDNYPHTPFAELALVFMSHDVYHEQCFREHPSSVWMQLKGNGFEELCSIDRPESNRIYNNEGLKVSVLLGQDYKLTEGQLESTDFIVESSSWWSTGHVVKLSLKGADGVRILCGRIGIEGQHGHVLEETFCELDRCGYVRRLLRVEGSILNVVPIAKKLDVPEEAINEAIETWKDDEEQLKIILQHWSKQQNDGCKEDPAVLRNTLQGLNPEVCEVDERGKMHINHLRELAFEIQSLNREDPHLMEYFTNQISTLCDSILKDCCIELDAEVSVENCPRFLSFHERVTEDVALKLEKICSFSTRSSNEDFFSIVRFLIQAIKEIFRRKSPLILQNGLRGLPIEIVSQQESKVRDAFANQDILRLVYEVCGVLEGLCLNNCEKHSTEMIESWSESLGIWNMSEFLKEFFQSSQDSKLHKRLQLFSRSLRRISADIRDIKEIEMRYFFNVALNLIKFATFDPSKLVRFKMTDSTKSPVICYCEAVKYDRPHDTYSQQFEIRKESEDELQLGAIAHVHLDGRICKVGAFESVIMLPPSSEEELAKCPITTLPVTVKRERTDSGTLRVVLSSTRKENISKALSLLKRDLGDDIMDKKQAEITESCLAVCCFAECVGVVRLRLLYKWRSESISVDSKDFVAIAEAHARDDYKSASDSDASSPFEAELAALSTASRSSDNNGNFVMDPSAMELIQRHSRQQFGRLELHLHQTFQKGHVCVTGENTSLHMEMPNAAQSFLQEGLCAPSQKSITAGPSSNDAAAAVSEQEKNESVERNITQV